MELWWSLYLSPHGIISNSIFFFFWSVIASQCCVSFCCTGKWISYMYTCISSLLSLLPPHQPSRSSQSTKLNSLCCAAASHQLSVLYMLLLLLVAQLCPILCSLMDCNLPGFSVHGDSPGKNTGVGCHALLQGIFLTQGLNPGLPHCRQILHCLSHQGSQFYTW